MVATNAVQVDYSVCVLVVDSRCTKVCFSWFVFGSSRFTSFYHNCRSAFSQAHTNGLSCPCVFYSQDKTATANQNSLSVLIALHIVQYSFLVPLPPC